MRKIFAKNRKTSETNEEILMKACYDGDILKIYEILEKYPTLLNQKLDDSRTILLMITERNFPDLVAYLLSFKDLQINCSNSEGQTALMIAAQNGFKSITGLLLKIPSLKINLQDKLGRTALHWACANGKKEIMRLLLSVPTINKEIKDHANCTAETLAKASLPDFTSFTDLLGPISISLEDIEKVFEKDQISVKFQLSEPKVRVSVNHSQEVSRMGIKVSNILKIIYGFTKQQDIQQRTTHDICEQFIKPITTKFQCSYCELLEAIDSSMVGIATVFISHAWSSNFTEMIQLLLDYFINEPEAIVWIDLFCNNQHHAPHRSLEWWTNTFKSAIAGIGRTVMFISSWNDPFPLTRGWCLWELYCTIDRTNGTFDIAIPKEAEQQFIIELEKEIESREKRVIDRSQGLPLSLKNSSISIVDKLVMQVDCRKSQCFLMEDRAKIHESIQKTVGSYHFNQRIIKVLQQWILKKYQNHVNHYPHHPLPDDSSNEEIVKERNARIGKMETNLGLLFYYFGEFEKAKHFYFTNLENVKSQSGLQSEEGFDAMHNLAEVYHQLGDYQKAEDLFTEILVRTAILPQERAHLSMLPTMICLTQLYMKTGAFNKAEPIAISLLTKCHLMYGESDERTIIVLYSLGTIYLQSDRSLQALEMIQCANITAENVFNQNHPNCLFLLNQLGEIYAKQGQFQKAEEIFEDCYQRFRTVSTSSLLSSHHPTILLPIKNLSVLYHKLSQYEKAEHFALLYYEKQIELFGEDHPETLNGMNDLITLYLYKENYQKMKPLALAYYQQAITLLGEKNLHSLYSMTHLAWIYEHDPGSDPTHAERNIQQAEKLRIHCYELSVEIFGENHPYTLLSMNYLAMIWMNHCKRSDSSVEQLLINCLERRKGVLGESHLDTLISFTNLLSYYQQTNRELEMLALFPQCITQAEQILGSDHLTTKTLKESFHEFQKQMSQASID